MSGSVTTLAGLVRRQTTALARQFVDEPTNAYIGIRTHSAMQMRQLAHGGRTAPLGDQPISRCFVYIDNTGEPELWVRAVLKNGPGGSGYNTDWNNFARTYLGADYAALDTAAFNIDHLYPETTGYREGLSHVRVMPVPADSNQAVGRTLEKLMANRSFGRDRPAHKATVVTFAKVAGFANSITLPEQRGDPVDEGVIRQLVELLQRRGFIEPGQLANDLTVHLTRWSVTRLQGGDADQLACLPVRCNRGSRGLETVQGRPEDVAAARTCR